MVSRQVFTKLVSRRQLLYYSKPWGKEEPKTLKLYFILCNIILSSTVTILPTVGILPAVGRAEGLLFILMQPVVKKLLVDLRLIDFVDYDFLCFCMNNRRCWTLVYKLRPVSLLFGRVMYSKWSHCFLLVKLKSVPHGFVWICLSKLFNVFLKTPVWSDSGMFEGKHTVLLSFSGLS